MDWTLLVTSLSALGAIGSAFYAKHQKSISNEAKEIAREAKDAAIRSADTSETSARTTEKALIQNYRPYVIVKMYCLDIKLHFEIVNLGNRTASDVKISVDPSFDDLFENNSIGIAVKGVRKMFNQKFLSPGHSLITYLAKNEDYLKIKKENESDIRKISIRYNSIEFNPTPEKEFEFEETYEIDIRSFLFDEKFATMSDNRQLGKITTELKNINTTLNNIGRIIFDQINNKDDNKGKNNP